MRGHGTDHMCAIADALPRRVHLPVAARSPLLHGGLTLTPCTHADSRVHDSGACADDAQAEPPREVTGAVLPRVAPWHTVRKAASGGLKKSVLCVPPRECGTLTSRIEPERAQRNEVEAVGNTCVSTAGCH